MRNFKLVQSRDEIKKDPAQVGKAVYDMLSKPQEMQEVGETLEAMTPRYYEELLDTIRSNRGRYESPFYIVVLRKKEPWALNVLRQWFIARQTRPDPKVLREDYPNYDHDVWKIKGDDLYHSWTLPTAQDAKTIMKNPMLYHSKLVDTIRLFNEGRLE